MGHKCNHILSPKSLRAFTFSLHHCSLLRYRCSSCICYTKSVEIILMCTICLLFNFDTLHLLWIADKTFERETASIVVQSTVWAAALDRMQRKKADWKRYWVITFWNGLFREAYNNQNANWVDAFLFACFGVFGGNLSVWENGNKMGYILSVTQYVNPLKSLYSYYCNWVWE